MQIVRFTAEDEPRFGLVQAGEVVHELDGDPLYREVQPTGRTHQLDEVRLLAPVIPRSKVIGVGRNYAEHAAELGNEVPAEPLVFFKPNTSVIGPGDGIVYPSTTHDLHFEGELAAVIGRIGRDVPVDRVGEMVFGYTAANDVTARDLQKSDGQWTRAKGYDTFCPLGPTLVTDLDAADVRLTTSLNGETKQDGSTALMVRGVEELVSWISSFTTLLPGDVILTGTPAGVGPMQVGDRVTVHIDGIGDLTNPVISRD